jgi:hypothetical protein
VAQGYFPVFSCRNGIEHLGVHRGPIIQLLAATEKIPNMAMVGFRGIVREIVIQGNIGF